MSTGSNVISLDGGVVIDTRTPDADVISCLKALLERAEAGELNGIACVVRYYDRSHGWERQGLVSVAMVGELEMLKARVIKALAEQE